MGILDLLGLADKIGSGVKDITDGIGNNTGKIITRIKDTVPPEMRGEIEKLQVQIDADIEKAKVDAAIKAQQLLQTAEAGFREFVIKYEGSATEVPKWILVIRSLIRPIITVFMFMGFMFFLGADLISISKHGIQAELIMGLLPQAFWVVLGIVLGFWFGGKIGENLVDKLKN
jgi:hypothetical protein